jgi:hypothetical protein
MFTGQRRQRTSAAANDVLPVSLDVSEGAELLVHHLAERRHPGPKVPRELFSVRQFVSESSAGLPKLPSFPER